MQYLDWNDEAKRLLKSELVRRGISNEELVGLLENIGVRETKTSIDSKVSRGTFSAAFLLQCLNAIGCKNFTSEIEVLSMAADPGVSYNATKMRYKKNSK